MKICLIGNSHAGAWKRGWESIAPRYPHVSLSVFASAAKTLKFLQPDGPVFTTDHAELRSHLERGGAPVIDTRAYDLFVLVLANFGVPQIVQLYSEWRGDSHKGREGGFTLISDACFRAAAAGRLNHALGARLYHELAAMTGKPIYAVPPPLPREGVLQSSVPHHLSWHMVHRAGDDGAIATLFEELLAEFCGNRAIPVRQPSVTLHSPILTQDRWAVDAHKAFGTEGPQPEDDVVHMNGEYGELCLADLFAAAGIAPA